MNIVFNQISYHKDNKTGYYLATKSDGNKPRKRLHRAVWEFYNGEIPKGYEIHHIDFNKDNNDISNLQLVTKAQHNEIHAKSLTEERKKQMRENLEKNARPKAIEWHKSKEGRAWHKLQYQNSLGKYNQDKENEIEYTCLNCGKKFVAKKSKQRKFCSPNCKSAFRKKSGVDNEKRKCKKCGKEFITNKYSTRKYCTACKSKKC